MRCKPIKRLCERSDNDVLRSFGDRINLCQLIRDRINEEVNPDAPNQVNRGNVIKPGVDPQLDELREISVSSKDYLMRLQKEESERTGIPSLKIAYNNVFG